MSSLINNLLFYNNKIIIAGPCALESKEQLKNCVKFLRTLGIKAIRASIWKPRTTPSWDGLGINGLHYFLEETFQHGMIPASEVLTSQQAKKIVETVQEFDPNAGIILWIGARNQNHIEQRLIAQVLAENLPNALLMFKNQMWEDEIHWLGIYDHLISAGYPHDKLITVHRGFSPGQSPNPENLRNIPNYEMAMRVKNKLEIPVLCDPSHIAGSVDKVFHIAETALLYDFDGYLIEVHDNAKEAKTDSKQQLSFSEFEKLLQLLLLEEKVVKIHKQAV